MAAKYLFISYLLVCILSTYGYSQEKTVKPTEKPEMKIEKFWFVLLKTGPKTDFDSSVRAGLFKGHMDNMGRLHKEGILKVAGPFGKNELTWRGIFILACKTLEEAQAHTRTDPAISAGLFAVDIVPWYTEPSGSFLPGKPAPN